MLEIIKLDSGDVALVANDTLVMCADPAMDDVAYVEVVGANLAAALCESLAVVEMAGPGTDDWTWEGLIETLALGRAAGMPQ